MGTAELLKNINLFIWKVMYLCDCVHPPVFVITSLTDYDVDPPAMPPMHACLNEMSHLWFIVEYENSCIFVFVILCFCDTFPQRMLAWINWWMKCHLRHMIHWPSGGLCVFWYYQKKTPSMRNCPCLWFTRPFGHWPIIIPIIFFCPWIWMVLLMLQSFYEE